MISDEWIAKVKANQPELRTEKLERYQREFDLPKYDAEIITGHKNLQTCLRRQPSFAANRTDQSCRFGSITNTVAKEVLNGSLKTTSDPEKYVEKKV